tara:strand:+ start:380 stop:502 length:123 start_codon:yes stop_codon:yes gene_type:complete
VLKKFRYVAFVRLEPATSVARESGTFSLEVLEIVYPNVKG